MFYSTLSMITTAIIAFSSPLSTVAEPGTTRKTTRKTYTISVSPPTFIPLQNASNITDVGSQLLFNGVVSGNGEQGTFNQKCTAMKMEVDTSGQVPKIEIQEIMCSFNFCLQGRDCLFLHSGGPFLFNPFSSDPEDVPEIEAYIIGGTGEFGKVFGGARLITQKRTDGGTGIGEFKFDLYYRRKRNRDIVKYKPNVE